MKALETFHVSNPEAWQDWVEKNTDPYGRACVEYAARWAHLMEERLAQYAVAVGETPPLGAIAKQASHDADTEGITGFMYGAAVSMLAACWVHGDALRRWHNLDTQIGDEGARANADGGVLNPALLNIQTKDTP